MLKNLAGLEYKVENIIIKLICDSDCPLAHIKEALFQFSKYVGQIEDSAKSAQEKLESEKETVDSKVEELKECNGSQ